MSPKQRKYWEKIISYIITSEAVIDDLINCDEDYEAADQKREERLKFLADNYTLNKKSMRHMIKNLTLGNLLNESKGKRQ